MRRSIAVLLAAGTTAMLGCGGAANREDGRQVVEGAGGNQMAATDLEVVADKVQAIERACRRSAPAAAFVRPARVIAGVAVRAPRQVFESGNVDEALQMRDLAGRIAVQLGTCNAPGAAAILRRAAGAAG